MSLSDIKLLQEIERLVNLLDEQNPSLADHASFLYVSDSRITEYIERLEELIDTKGKSQNRNKQIGETLEQISHLAFQSIKGVTSLKSYRSAGPQYDLVVNGNSSAHWSIISKVLLLNQSRPDILVECKATKSKVTDQQFSRLCNLMDVNISTADLGVFFSINGATGFPSAKRKSRQTTIGAAKLRQVLYHANTKKKVIVLDLNDIRKLGTNGSFIRILNRKIRDITELSGMPIFDPEKVKEVDLPPHLSMLMQPE